MKSVQIAENVTVAEKIEVALSAPTPPPWWVHLNLGRGQRVAEWLHEKAVEFLLTIRDGDSRIAGNPT